MSMLLAEIKEIASGLHDCTFPAARFRHREHCLATAYFLQDQPQTDWRRELPILIRRYNESMGGANTEDAGYHETITQFYIDVIEDFLERCAGESIDAACAALLASPIACKSFALEFYSRERLFSREARRRYLPPDLKPFRAERIPMKYTAVNLRDKFSLFAEQWSPKVVAEMNDYQFKIVKLKGDFVWHDHPDTDETFIVIQGAMRIDFRDGAVDLSAGEMFVVPKGKEHKPFAAEEVQLLLIEPRGVVNTGVAGGERTAPKDIWI
jgi:mannose-6-phosphate isomerase-like protein (cupin superfamily)